LLTPYQIDAKEYSAPLSLGLRVRRVFDHGLNIGGLNQETRIKTQRANKGIQYITRLAIWQWISNKSNKEKCHNHIA